MGIYDKPDALDEFLLSNWILDEKLCGWIVLCDEDVFTLR